MTEPSPAAAKLLDILLGKKTKQLSPSAQAVLDAYQDASIDDALTAAAVIRSAVAVTQQCQGKDCLSDEVWTCDADELLAIADELDLNEA